MRNHNITWHVIVCLLVIIISSCSEKKKSGLNSMERSQINKEFSALQAKLPMEILGIGITITSIALEGDMVAYTCTLTPETWNELAIPNEAVQSDRNIARVISNFDKNNIAMFIDKGLGIKYVYTNSITNEIFMQIEMTPSRLKEVSEKLKNGEIEPYTVVELAKMEIAKIQIPSQIEEGVWLTDAYIKEGNIYYEATLEEEINETDLDPSAFNEIRDGIIQGLREEGIFAMNKKQIIKENVHLIYIYKDNRGIEFARIEVSPRDIYSSSF